MISLMRTSLNSTQSGLPAWSWRARTPSLSRQARGVVGEIEDQPAIEIVLDVVSLANDDNVVPVVQFEQLLELFPVDQRAGNVLLAIVAPGGFLAGEADAAAFAALIVDEPGDVGQLELVAKFVLIAAHNPFVPDLALGDVLRPVLNSRIVRRAQAKRQTQLEILGRATLPNEERIAGGRLLGGGFAVNDAVSHGPQPRIAVPTGQVFAVEDSSHVSRFGRGHLRTFGKGVDGKRGEREEHQGTEHRFLPRVRNRTEQLSPTGLQKLSLGG